VHTRLTPTPTSSLTDDDGCYYSLSDSGAYDYHHAVQINSRRIDKEAMVEQYQADCMSHGRLSAEASAHAAHIEDLARFMGGLALRELGSS
jgi:hypothetical protein